MCTWMSFKTFYIFLVHDFASNAASLAILLCIHAYINRIDRKEKRTIWKKYSHVLISNSICNPIINIYHIIYMEYIFRRHILSKFCLSLFFSPIFLFRRKPNSPVMKKHHWKLKWIGINVYRQFAKWLQFSLLNREEEKKTDAVASLFLHLCISIFQHGYISMSMKMNMPSILYCCLYILSSKLIFRRRIISVRFFLFLDFLCSLFKFSIKSHLNAQQQSVFEMLLFSVHMALSCTTQTQLILYMHAYIIICIYEYSHYNDNMLYCIRITYCLASRIIPLFSPSSPRSSHCHRCRRRLNIVLYSNDFRLSSDALCLEDEYV